MRRLHGKVQIWRDRQKIKAPSSITPCGQRPWGVFFYYDLIHFCTEYFYIAMPKGDTHGKKSFLDHICYLIRCDRRACWPVFLLRIRER